MLIPLLAPLDSPLHLCSEPPPINQNLAPMMTIGRHFQSLLMKENASLQRKRRCTSEETKEEVGCPASWGLTFNAVFFLNLLCLYADVVRKWSLQTLYEKLCK